VTSTIAIIVFVVGLIGSIMVHEWGHFVTARRFGMRADRFFLGFGPTLWSTQIGETEYGVKALPLGGFVRIIGMSPLDERLPSVPVALAERVADGAEPVTTLRELLVDRGTPKALVEQIVGRYDRMLTADIATLPFGEAGAALDVETLRELDPAMLAVEVITSDVPPSRRLGDLHHRLLLGDEGRFFTDRPAWQRAIVLAAGSALHFAQAVVIIFLGWLLVGPQILVPVVAQLVDAELSDGTIVDSAAEAAGIEVGDRLLAVDGVISSDFEQLRLVIRDRAGQPVAVLIERPGTEQPIELTITPSSYLDPVTGETVGLLGFIPDNKNRPMDADEALYSTFVGPGSFTQMLSGTIGALGNVFGPAGIAQLGRQVTGDEERALDGGISLVGAASAAGQGTESFGPLFLFSLLASVNVFVGIFNALPLPPLDGGHLAVLGVEKAVNTRRKKRDEPQDFSVNPQTIAAVAVPVIVFVATISLALVYLDITNPLSF
jgi:regulator of sigma E protease